MMKLHGFVVSVVMLILSASVVLAQQSTWGNVLKAAGQAAVAQWCPQAQGVIDQAQSLPTPASKENFVVTKAKEFLAAKNYQPALDLANYVLTNLNAKSLSAKKIMEDAKAALMKTAQDKINAQPQVNTAQQIKTDATQTATDIKNLFSTKK